MMRKFYWLFLLSIVLVLNGCMDGTPTESDGRKVFEDSIPSKSEIVSFKKTNGKKSEYGGAEYYTMYYEAEIIYPNGKNLECKKFRGAGRVANAGRYPDAFYKCMMLTIKEKGEKKGFEGEINFEKTENGWIGKRSYY